MFMCLIVDCVGLRFWSPFLLPKSADYKRRIIEGFLNVHFANSLSHINKGREIMDEKTAMTVEFLRARLLSERNVSRTARQRADVFAQRVMELEEQLRIVNSQKKKLKRQQKMFLPFLKLVESLMFLS
ncbi:hypothetical protein HPP92_001756 [Vanilla planifolia]|uniref:Uncharacterized protein n=1 Tax=Vanilla planifolia TaxID=51239 RepID=A0A835VIA4_VANPL|nr:hypothetical protein HPP92_001756 [Vanilla planifolia]